MFKKKNIQTDDHAPKNTTSQTHSFSSICLFDANNNKTHPLSPKQSITNIISAYNGTTYITLKDNSFMVYGYNAHGQLGLNHFDYVPELIQCQQFKIQNIFSSISSKHSFCITQQNTLYAVGNNLNNQFGIPTQQNTLNKWIKINPISFNITIQSISTSWEYTLFLTINGQIYQTNNNNIKLIQIDRKNTKFKSIDCGKYHSLAISENNNLYSWGSNKFGQLGHGDELIINLPQKVMYFVENNIWIHKISCGLYHSLALDLNGKVYCFGSNNNYQLGNGMKHAYLRLPQLNNALLDEIIIDIACGGYHNLVMNRENKYFLWGLNINNQCLVYNKNDIIDENNIDFIKIPKKYKYNQNEMRIINIYIGYKTTLIIKKIYDYNNGNNNPIICNKNNRKNKLLFKVRSWYNSLKLNMNSLKTSTNRMDENKYNNDDLNDLNNFKTQSTSSIKEYGEYYVIKTQKKENKCNSWNKKSKKMKYSALSLNEC